MRTVIRWALVVAVTMHGLIHFLGAAKGLGWAEVPQLTAPIGPTLGAYARRPAVASTTRGG